MQQPIESSCSPCPSDSAAATACHGRVILLVDDETAILRAAAYALRARGFTVVTAVDGEEALRAATRMGTVDLVLTDVVMPRLDGLALVAQLRRHCPEVRALFMSGHPRQLLERDGRWPPGTSPADVPLAGVPPLLEKPFALSELLARVRDALG